MRRENFDNGSKINEKVQQIRNARAQVSYGFGRLEAFLRFADVHSQGSTEEKIVLDIASRATLSLAGELRYISEELSR